MTIKNRLKKLETASSTDCLVLPPKFVAFEGMDTQWAIVPGLDGGFHREEGENLGEFCQRAFKAYATSKGLEKCRSNELSDEDLQFIVAADCPELALKLCCGKELSNADVKSIVGKQGIDMGCDAPNSYPLFENR
ncbi:MULTISPECIES: hypothetical protein [unclassified Ruegeria]|uniref:hypothetical protein n=1 Tax=unclassified Ruegeria TaxID=2625375 RepID=UPI001489A305|nr:MULTISPECIES: hypothetical protein [unclassified Ruegeria]NOD88748.1 hypothetical protein [Ruegeria sp. HKCCD4318]NOE16143.1 hypothetical protein [Ruegeria sp. HKCCD4318-2]NOG09812.1 hypothetical protein [Ruegeria sp. HKCCD4315]